MGLHGRHQFNQEQSIKEFVNKESISLLDDLNADTILTFNMVEEPLLLAFVDLSLWEKDEKKAEHQRKYTDEVHKLLNIKLHNKAVAILVPIDDSKFGNLAIRDAFGLTDGEQFPHYPQLVMFHPNDGRFSVLEHPQKPAPSPKFEENDGKRGKTKKGEEEKKVKLFFNELSITKWVNSLEVLKT